MRGFQFSKFLDKGRPKGGFDEMLKLFTELLNYTAGDAGETLAWMNELDKQYKFTNNDYAMGDFIDDLKEKGYLKEENGEVKITAKTEQTIRKSALEEIFGKLKKAGKGNHNSIQARNNLRANFFSAQQIWYSLPWLHPICLMAQLTRALQLSHHLRYQGDISFLLLRHPIA